jgi:hypothetical protein
MLLVGPEGSGKPSRRDLGRTGRRARDIGACAYPAAVPGALATGALVVEDLRPPISTSARCYTS